MDGNLRCPWTAEHGLRTVGLGTTPVPSREGCAWSDHTGGSGKSSPTARPPVLFVCYALPSASLHKEGGRWMRVHIIRELLGPRYDDGVRRSQLQRTSRGWVRIKKHHPLIQIGELGRARRNIVWSPLLLPGFCWPAFFHFFLLRCCSFGICFSQDTTIFEKVQREVLWTGSSPCREQTGNFTSTIHFSDGS